MIFKIATYIDINHISQLIHLKCIIHWLLACSQSVTINIIKFQTFFITSKRNCSLGHFLPRPPSPWQPPVHFVLSLPLLDLSYKWDHACVDFRVWFFYWLNALRVRPCHSRDQCFISFQCRTVFCLELRFILDQKDVLVLMILSL